MAVTDTDTVREFCADAMIEAGRGAQDEEADPTTIERARRILQRMLKSWQNMGYQLWTVSSMSVTATTSEEYTLDPVRPHDVVSVRFKRSGLETPMEQMTRDEYDSLPDKASTGTPTCWYFDRQREDARLVVWPVLAAANGETLEITYHREINDLVLSDPIDIPGEWYEAAFYGLAARLAVSYGTGRQGDLSALANTSLASAQADDREGSVFFGSGE